MIFDVIKCKHIGKFYINQRKQIIFVMYEINDIFYYLTTDLEYYEIIPEQDDKFFILKYYKELTPEELEEFKAEAL